MSKQTISHVLRETLRQRGTEHLYDVARGSGVDYNKLWRFLTKDRPLTMDESDALAAYLGCRLVRPKVTPPLETATEAGPSPTRSGRSRVPR
ncbi:MAG TPA: hypothetical protein VGY66_10235 [Gemmataceae bacterium]|jgi:hypothetical protein|nr:hypothetical protein [Gemmataceae bacterium]